MLITSHVAAGAIIGATVNRPIPAFLLGVASHFGMDMVPHWGGMGNIHSDEFMHVAKRDGIAGLVEIAAIVAAAGDRKIPVMAGIAGACLPDMDKPSDIYLGRSPFPAKVDEFHKNIQNEYPDKIRKDAIGAAVLAVGAVALVAWLGRRK